MQLPGCGNKAVDCQAPLSEDSTCAIGEFVTCPGTTDRCHGNQCCPDGSTCPSAPAAVAEGCGPKKASCELLEWKVKFRVASILFANVSNDTKDIVEALSAETIAAEAGLDAKYINVTSSAGAGSESGRRLAESGMTLTAVVSAPGGWSQKKLDNTVESNILSDELRLEIQEMMSELDGLQEASSGEFAIEQIEGQRDEPQGITTPSPHSSVSATTSQKAQSTSLRGGDTKEPTDTTDSSHEVTSSASSYSFLPTVLVLFSICREFLLLIRGCVTM